jgi:hypothetical protein
MPISVPGMPITGSGMMAITRSAAVPISSQRSQTPRTCNIHKHFPIDSKTGQVVAFADSQRRLLMDFFERFFHVSLDGGNGLAELAFLFGFIALTVVATFSKLHAILELPIERLRGTRHVQEESHPQT